LLKIRKEGEVSEKSMGNAHNDASEAKKAPNHSAFQPQKGVLVLQNQLPAVKFRRISSEAEKGDSG
jgi:hypothetical protein